MKLTQRDKQMLLECFILAIASSVFGVVWLIGFSIGQIVANYTDAK